MYAKSFRHVVVVLFGFLSLQFGRAETAPDNWATGIFHDRRKGDAHHVFQLEMVSEGDPIIGKFSFGKSDGKETVASPFVIEGHQGEDGTFWPHVQLEVKTEPDGKWIKIASSLDTPVSAKLSVYKEMLAYGLFVDLHSFKAYFGKYSFGRVVLRSGETAVITLKDLAKWSKGSAEDKNSD
jgi:hypothetical protein